MDTESEVQVFGSPDVRAPFLLKLLLLLPRSDLFSMFNQGP